MTGSIKSIKFFKPETLTVETGNNSSAPKEPTLNKQLPDWESNKRLYLD